MRLLHKKSICTHLQLSIVNSFFIRSNFKGFFFLKYALKKIWLRLGGQFGFVPLHFLKNKPFFSGQLLDTLTVNTSINCALCYSNVTLKQEVTLNKPRTRKKTLKKEFFLQEKKKEFGFIFKFISKLCKPCKCFKHLNVRSVVFKVSISI